MQAYRIATRIQVDGSLVVRHLPLTAGEEVEVIVLVQDAPRTSAQMYPLRGMALDYQHPTEPVAEADWDATA